MSEQTQTAQGGFVQGITLPVVGGCCGTAGASPTTSCCSEPVMASAPPAGVQAAAGCCGEPVVISVSSSSEPAATGCCGEPVAPQEKPSVPSQSCCG